MQQLTRDSEKMLKYIFKAAEPVKVSALKKRFKASTKISINELSDIGYIYIASKLSRWGEPLEEVKYQITEDGVLNIRKTIDERRRLILNSVIIPIIVPYNEEASGIIDELNGKTTISQALELQRKAQQYTVSVYDYTFKKLAENDALNEIKVRQDEKVYIYALKKEFYNNATGLSTEGKPQEAMFV